MSLNQLFENFRIRETEAAVSDLGFKADSNEVNLRSLQDQVDHLSLVCMAMCELMEEIGFNKSMLLAKIKEIDLRDGKLDGKYVDKKSCPKCKREVAARHVRCIYCGTSV